MAGLRILLNPIFQIYSNVCCLCVCRLTDSQLYKVMTTSSTFIIRLTSMRRDREPNYITSSDNVLLPLHVFIFVLQVMQSSWALSGTQVSLCSRHKWSSHPPTHTPPPRVLARPEDKALRSGCTCTHNACRTPGDAAVRMRELGSSGHRWHHC